MPPRRDPLRDQLQSLAALQKQPLPGRDDPAHATRQELLRAALAGKSCFAVAAAADLVHESDAALLKLLPATFERFLHDSGQPDKGCVAKTAIARALERVDASDDRVFRRGLFHVQMEPIFGGQQDCAVELRGICALGLARLSPSGVLSLLAELLADPQQGARAAAARALGCTGQMGAVPLLRYKALCGDSDPLVLSECLTALLLLERETALPFVGRFLTPDDPERADPAALALGQSRLADAIPLLREYAELPPRGERKAALWALALLREPAATDYLLELVRDADTRQAAQAIEALGMHRYDAALSQRLTEAVESRRNPALTATLAKALS